MLGNILICKKAGQITNNKLQISNKSQISNSKQKRIRQDNRINRFIVIRQDQKNIRQNHCMTYKNVAATLATAFF